MSSIRTKLSNRQTVMFKKEKDLVCTVTCQYRQNSNKTLRLLWNKAIFRIFQYICFFVLFFQSVCKKSRLLYSFIYCLCHSVEAYLKLVLHHKKLMTVFHWSLKMSISWTKRTYMIRFQNKGTLGIGFAVCDTVGVT